LPHHGYHCIVAPWKGSEKTEKIKQATFSKMAMRVFRVQRLDYA
jgi:hypothetical protein